MIRSSYLLAALLCSLGAAAATAATAEVTLTAPMSGSRLIQVLDQTIDWYRTLATQRAAATSPSDLLILDDNRAVAERIVSAAFDLARADAELLADRPAQDTQSGDTGISPQTLNELRLKLEAQSATLRAQLDAQHTHPGTAADAKARELEGELELIATKRGIVDTLTGFSKGGGATSALRSQIEAMAIAVPPANESGEPRADATAANPSATASGTASTTAAQGVPAAVRFGLWELAANAIRLYGKSATLESIDRRTASLQSTLVGIRGPLIEQIKGLSARGDRLAAHADTNDPATLHGIRAELDLLGNDFKRASTLLIPLSKESVLLTQYRRNLATWSDSIRLQTHEALRTLAMRLGGLGIVLACLFAAAELWRRAVLRYTQDGRRRYQLLLLRRITLCIVTAVIIGVAFASELGSILTFAGLLTAGIAVAMQSVLVSMVGYFFLIGKYGIRVGDRVQIGEVVGEVIDLGLVRLYLMELGAKGASGPTGRVVAFANSVVFQVASGLFKQIPGVNFSWREITLTLPAEADPVALKERLITAVATALEDYRPEILRQSQEIHRATLSKSAGEALPEVQLRFAANTVEARVRYPVHLQNAAEIEERVTGAVVQVVASATQSR